MDLQAPAPDPTFRLVAGAYLPIGAFDTVSTASDLLAVMELAGWTDDRRVMERIQRLPRSEWVFGRPNSGIVMGAFLHTQSEGLRFNSGDLGCWYAAATVNTAAIEVGHHLRRELAANRQEERRVNYVAFRARLAGSYLDNRGQQSLRPDLYDSESYAAGQRWGESIRASGGNGIIYDSIQHLGGMNVAALRARNILDVAAHAQYEVHVTRQEKKIRLRCLAG